jgi:hypothetical protein
MARDEPESLWNFGEPEAWRRGRNILITMAAFYATVQAIVFVMTLLGGGLEVALGIAINLVLWWLGFAFIWLGTHWIRWLLGAWTMALGFVLFIWGMRDQSIMQWSSGVVDLLIGAFCFAPSVHHFAVRQKENIRWPEKVVVAVVVLALFASVVAAWLGVSLSRSFVEGDARRFGEEALRRLFAENDTAFLLESVTDAWKNNQYGNLGVTRVLTEKEMRLGWVENTRVSDVALRSFYDFPATLRYAGMINGAGIARCGAVVLRLEVHRLGDEWRINGVWWQCLNTR